MICWLLSMGLAQAACTANIVSGSSFGTLQAAIDAAVTGSTIEVVGDCTENVRIPEGKDRITLDGLGAASISGPNAASATVNVQGRGTIITRFTISGGENGVHVYRGGTATIDENIIQATGSTGINVNQSSFAVIVNNTVRNIASGNGITINENSAARIGFVSGADTVASPNTIQNNGGRGIVVTRASEARIVGNTISGNTDDGIAVTRNSQASAAANVINSNGGDGVFVSTNSGVNLGNDTGFTIFDSVNTTSAGNTGFGIRCTINAYANGRLGSLTGASGPSSFTGTCVNSLIP